MSDAPAAPTVSVVIPVYLSERYLAEALGSILGQTRPPDEVLVVDDGSPDASAAIAEGFPGVEVLRRANGGVSAARNTGIAAATGDLLAMCDADDRWEPTKLARQLAVLAERPDVDVVFTAIEEFVEPGTDAVATHVRPAFERSTGPLPSSMLARRWAVAAAGPFDESLRVGDWIEWYLRLADTGAVAHTIDEVLVHRRLHGRNNSLRRSTQGTEYLHAFRDHLARMRHRS
jgi:glycosyltransferase involved in cell wall biosynthesis